MAVGLTSPGGILFCQERIGLGGKPFIIYKFRTMRKENSGLKITASGDDRITPVGRILRKTKLDELPQLFNVLRGDMSFVGPRPGGTGVYRFVHRGAEAGVSGPSGDHGVASIRYRNENDLLAASDDPNRTYIQEILPEKLRLDLSYIPRAGVVQDIALIFETLAVVIRG